MQVLKIVDKLFLFCSGPCLETPSFDVFFSSHRSKAPTLLVVSLWLVSSLFWFRYSFFSW